MAFSLTERDADWAGGAPVHHSQETEVAAAPDAVWATLADHASWPQWFRGMTRVVVDGDGAGVGATRTVWLGPARARERFVAWEPGRRFAFCLTESNAPGLRSMVEVIDLRPAGPGRTAVRYTVGIEAAAVPSLLDPGLKVFARQVVANGLKGLAARHR
jgi:uncharacterized protein YndB with AHSA1/START domain